MESWAVASLFLIIWLHQNVEAQLFDYQRPYQQQQQPAVYYPTGKSISIDQPHSAGGLQLQAGSNSAPLYDRFEEEFSNGFRNYEVTEDNDIDRHGQADQESGRAYDYDDYKVSQTTYPTGPQQVETIKTEHYHKKSKPFDVSSFEHKSDEKHAEVHYHQHKHVHNHEHKQDHIHEHKQEHQHKHVHNQKHKHEHHQDHKHGHEHKHEHHQEHKHEHHQEHKHEHHQEHKHGHNHKHEHHQDHKHHHGHKHEHHQKHKHGHKHGHKHHHTKH